MGLIREAKLNDMAGKLFNPHNTLMLPLAAAAVQDVNNKKYFNNVTYACIAMNRTRMSLKMYGCWEETQLTTETQETIRSYRNHIEELEVGNED